MPFITVCVVVIENGNVLLTKRNDFHVWCLPSGGVEDGESVAEAAMRETQEESGLKVQLTRLVGIYSRSAEVPSGHAVVFAAAPCSGEMRPQPGETLEVRYFSPDALPAELAFGHRQRIQHALEGVSGAAFIQRMPQAPEQPRLGREELYALRDSSGLSPAQFYMEYYKPDQLIEERLL